jgi:Outer membrane protein beta-barrel domain
MLRFFAAVLALILLTLAPAALFAQDKLVVFGGYSFLRPPVTVTEICNNCLNPVAFTSPTNSQNLNGWELSGTYRFLPFLGVTADLSGHYGNAFSSSSSNVHQLNYLFGPEVSLPSRVSPFARVLFGGSHQSITPSTLPGTGASFSILSSTTSGFATAFGAGIDLKLIPHVWIRPIQVDYLITRLGSNTQNQARVSAGVVFHF